MEIAIIVLCGIIFSCALLPLVWEPARAFWWTAVMMTFFIFAHFFGLEKMLKTLDAEPQKKIPVKTPAEEKYAAARSRITEAYAKGDIDAEEMGSKLYTILANEETAETIRKSGDGI